jgi:hypothetical protein
MRSSALATLAAVSSAAQKGVRSFGNSWRLCARSVAPVLGVCSKAGGRVFAMALHDGLVLLSRWIDSGDAAHHALQARPLQLCQRLFLKVPPSGRPRSHGAGLEAGSICRRSAMQLAPDRTRASRVAEP